MRHSPAAETDSVRTTSKRPGQARTHPDGSESAELSKLRTRLSNSGSGERAFTSRAVITLDGDERTYGAPQEIGPSAVHRHHFGLRRISGVRLDACSEKPPRRAGSPFCDSTG
jgi:hypothetical protein